MTRQDDEQEIMILDMLDRFLETEVAVEFHGHAHGAEAVADGAAGYMAGFAIMTAALHLAGIGAGVALRSVSLKPVVRIAGAACVLIGVALSLQLV